MDYWILYWYSFFNNENATGALIIINGFKILPKALNVWILRSLIVALVKFALDWFVELDVLLFKIVFNPLVEYLYVKFLGISVFDVGFDILFKEIDCVVGNTSISYKSNKGVFKLTQ